jgi:hypothetical protein
MIFESRLISEIQRLIREDLNERHTSLGDGSMVSTDDPHVAGMRFARAVGGIAGLKAALQHIEQAEKNLSIRPKKGEA